MCPHITRVPLKQKFLTTLRTLLMTIPSDPILGDILLEGANSAILSSPFPFHLFPLSYHTLCTNQCAIGWLPFFRGFADPLWRTSEQTYRSHHSISNKLPSILSIPAKLLPILHSMWLYRNSHRHDADIALQETELRRQTLAKLQHLYSIRTSVLPPDRVVFFPSLDHHLSQPLTSILAWLSNHHEHLLTSHSQASDNHTTHMRPITSYFHSSS